MRYIYIYIYISQYFINILSILCWLLCASLGPGGPGSSGESLSLTALIPSSTKDLGRSQEPGAEFQHCSIDGCAIAGTHMETLALVFGAHADVCDFSILESMGKAETAGPCPRRKSMKV